MLLLSLLWATLYVLVIGYVSVRVFSRFNRWRTRKRYRINPHAIVIGFFHPYADSRGGGERVLWRAIYSLSKLVKEQRQQSAGRRPLHILIYTGDDPEIASKETVLRHVQEHFQIVIQPTNNDIALDLVYIKCRGLLEASNYPIFTMLGQSIGSMLLVLEALIRATPQIYFDSTGYAFTFAPAAWLFGCKIGAYVHYPTISTDMLKRVRASKPSYNNRGWIAGSTTASRLKLIYYRAMALGYGAVGSLASVVMVNSNWTKDHIAALWRWAPPPQVVFPPCDTSDLMSLPLKGPEGTGREAIVLSVGQFRPEKDHALQLHSFAELKALGAEYGHVRLVIVGSCRNAGDDIFLQSLKEVAVELGVSDDVTWIINCPYSELRDWLGRASVGIHTMWMEHFGIGVVEMMAAGLITIAHKSGGPLQDIIVPLDKADTGCLAETPEQYAALMAAVFARRDKKESSDMTDSTKVENRVGKSKGKDDEDDVDIETEIDDMVVVEGRAPPSSPPTERNEVYEMRNAARESAKRFSNEVFDDSFVKAVTPLLLPFGFVVPVDPKPRRTKAKKKSHGE